MDGLFQDISDALSSSEQEDISQKNTAESEGQIDAAAQKKDTESAEKPEGKDIEEGADGSEMKKDEGSEGGEPDDNSPVLEVTHNHQLFSLNRDDATDFVQKGMKYDELKTTIDQLGYVAAQSGIGLKALAEQLYAAQEEDIKSRAKELAGDDEKKYNELVELAHSRNQKAYDDLQAAAAAKADEDGKAVAERIAGEYLELKKEFPEYDSYDKLPKDIISLAQKNHISLLDAKLRYDRANAAAAAANSASAKKAAEASAGSAGGKADEQDDTVAAMLKGIYGK